MIKKKLLNQIKNASKNNENFLITKFSQPAKELTEYLIENKMIEGVCKKNNLMIIFLSYSVTNKPVIKETSVIFKELTPQEKITNKIRFTRKRKYLVKIHSKFQKVLQI